MAKQKKKKSSKDKKAINDFKIHINEFGEISSTIKVEDLNAYLDETVADKKLTTNHPLSEEE